MKKRVLNILMAAVMTAALLSGCSSGSSESSDSTAGAAESSDTAEKGSEENGDESKVLRVGLECAYPPFNWMQDSPTTPDGTECVPLYNVDGYYAYGYDVAVAKMVAEELGMELEIHRVEWSSIGISLETGVYDCIISGMGRTAEREMSYSFTEPYYYRHNCIVVKKDGKYADVKGLSDLDGTGCVVTTQVGTGWIPLTEQIKGAKTGTNYETIQECFMAISNGTADVMIVDIPGAESAAMTNDDLKIIVLDENDTFTGDDEMVNICIATRKDDTALRDKLQGALDAVGLNNQETMDSIMSKVITQQPAAN
ncbi:MAG: transporter substrate-binding domain-containing protein [Ruminococcus sp.]|jgi:putative lysine transport system substrate-binding protein